MGSLVTPPWHLSGKPYEVQLEALRRSRGHNKYAYFCEMGMGKSAIVLNDWIENFSELNTAIVLAPNSFKVEWVLLPGQWGINITGSYWPNDLKVGRSGKPHLNVINYEAIRGSAHDPVAKIMDKHKCLLIADESSAFKNFQSDTARAVLDLSKRASAVRILNGTPMSNNVMDLYPQLKCIGQLDKVNPYAFRNRYGVMGGWMGRQIVGVKNEEELHQIINEKAFVAKKVDWLDLPEKIYTSVHLEMTTKQQKIYKEMLKDFCTIVNGEEFTATMIIDQLNKLRQLSGGIIIKEGKHALIEDPSKNPKLKATMDIIEANSGSKTIVVHYYTKTGEMIYNELVKKKLQPAFIKGGMTPVESSDQKNRFNTDPNCRVLVAQITAGSRAHTFLGGKGKDRCHNMIIFDQTFSLMDRQQVEDRIHRGAQDKACNYYDLILSPVDEVQLKALKEKANLASVVVDAVRAMVSR